MTDLTPSELRDLAWRQLPCDSCEEPAGRRCVTSSGARTAPHAARMSAVRGWLARQPWVDTLEREVEQLGAVLTRAHEQLAVEQATVAERDQEISGLGIQAAGLRADVKAEKIRADDAVETLAAHMRTHDVPEPDPEPPAKLVTRFGACPEKPGNPHLAGQTQVVTKWGKDAAARVFYGTEAATRHPDVSILHASWKPTLAQITEQWVTSVTKALKPGDCVEVWHELDKKITDGILTQADGEARKNKFFDIVTKVRPDLLVVDTRTGWSLDPKSGKNPRAIKVRAHVLGVDCDGVRPTSLPYTNYDAETATALAMIGEDNDYELFSVPEFGCPRIPAADPEGKIRAEYHEKYARLWAESGKCAYVTLYEYDSNPNYSLTTAAEKAQWSARVTASR